MMALRLGDTAPNFTAKTSIGEIDFHDFLGNSWGILFSHPADFTPVCTTELGTTAKLTNEFIARDTKVLALSVDGVESHKEWGCDASHPHLFLSSLVLPLYSSSFHCHHLQCIFCM